jgi:type III secretion protein T
VTADPALAALSAQAVDVALHSLRLWPVAALSPFLGGPLLPPLARAGLAVALGWAIRELLGGSGAGLPSGAGLLAAGTRELALGAALAVVASLPLEAARGAGRLVDTLRGATLGELHVAPIRQQETALGDLLVQWTLALAAWRGADSLLVASILDTYRAVPVGAALPAHALLGSGTVAARELLSAAFCLGAPAAAGLLCAEIALGVASRISPSMGLGGAAPATRAAIGLLAVALPAAAVGGRLVELVALPVGLLAGQGGARPGAGAWP